MDQSKKYDVAISLRWTDVEHARALYEILRDRLDVFFADEKQYDLVGTDGEKSFGHIFRDQSRVVVIFYRHDWGTTPFTRAEEAAIKQRAWNEGYNFSIWIPMDEFKAVPPYVPPQHVWFDFERYGVNGLASVVEERVRESGREVRPETAVDRLRKVKRRIDLEKERESFERSQDGVAFVADSFRRLEEAINLQLGKYREVSADIPFLLEREGDRLRVTSWPYRCSFHIDRYASNVITGASLTAYVNEHVNSSDRRDNWSKVKQIEFKPTLDDNGNPTWRLRSGECHSLETAIAHVLDDFAERVYLAVEKRVANR
ncbi:hypothetical protein HUU39_19250 [candidate division KSB1 bacterium]|nr:hypothetical protein [bacterium]NUM67381.1 hypothetical protein [candidate division KSB1 bacterium]